MKNLFLFLLLFIATHANAVTCTANPTNINFNIPPNFNFSPDVPINGIIGEFVGTRVSVAPCSSLDGANEEYIQLTALGVYGQLIDGIYVYSYDKYASIGYAIGGYGDGCEGTKWIGKNLSGAAPWENYCNKTGSSIKKNVYFTPILRLYKLSALGTSTTVPPNLVADVSRRINNNRYQGPTFSVTSTNIITSACTVSQNVVNVNMGNVEKRLFRGVGTSAGDTKDFNISLKCTRSANATITISGSAYNANNGILNILEHTKSAKGIAIQILKNNQILKLNSAVSIGKTTVGNYLIPLQARYYQTGNITPGSVNAVATFTVTYQ